MKQTTGKGKGRPDTPVATVKRTPATVRNKSAARPDVDHARPAGTVGTGKNALRWYNFRDVFQSAPTARIDLIRSGVPAADFKRFVTGLGVPQERVYRMLDIATATVNRKASREEPLTREESAKVVGMAKLIGQVETMLAESGDPEATAGFNAGKWLTTWMEQPVPALDGRRPAEYMDTIEGQEMIARILAMMQSGAYA